MVDRMLLFKKWNSGEFDSLFILDSPLRKNINKHVHTFAFYAVIGKLPTS